MEQHEQIETMMLFLKSIGERDAAEFVVNLQKAVDGLRQNNEAFQKEFTRLYRVVNAAKELDDKAPTDAKQEHLITFFVECAIESVCTYEQVRQFWLILGNEKRVKKACEMANSQGFDEAYNQAMLGKIL